MAQQNDNKPKHTQKLYYNENVCNFNILLDLKENKHY